MSTLSVSEVASRLNLSHQRVRELCRNGNIKAQKIGLSWAVDSDAIMSYDLTAGNKPTKNNAKYKVSSHKPIALSFFSGAMGLDRGLESAGFDIRLACEVDKFCRETIEINKPGTVLLGDINQYSAKQILEYAHINKSTCDVDLIVGGPPCQAFSTAGKRLGLNDERGNVFIKYLEIALEINPKFIVIENVRGLLSCPMQHRPHNKRGDGYPDLQLDELRGGALNFILNLIVKAGYSFSFNLYNAANYGSPQIRERVIMVCARDGKKVPYLPPTYSQNGEFGLKKWKTFRMATKDIKTHNFIEFPEKRLKYYRILKPGQNWRNLPTDLQKEALGKSFYAGGGKTGFFRRLAWDEPSPTLVTHPAMPATDLAHPEEDRPLSVEEYKKLQEFPEHWRFAGSLIQQYKQAGNAVPHSLGKALGQHLVKCINAEEIAEVVNFPYSRYKNTSDTDWLTQFEKSKHKIQSRHKQQSIF